MVVPQNVHLLGLLASLQGFVELGEVSVQLFLGRPRGLGHKAIGLVPHFRRRRCFQRTHLLVKCRAV